MKRRRSQQNQQTNFSNASKQADQIMARQDAWNAFVIWIFLEGLSLFILPNAPFISGQNKFGPWLLFSVPLGVIGACLIGVSSWQIKHVQEQVDRSHPNKPAMLFSAQAIGWIGLIGIGFPSLMVGATLWSYVIKGI